MPNQRIFLSAFAVIASLLAPVVSGQTRVLQLPTVTSETSPTGTVFSITPLTSVASFPAGIDTFGVFVRPTATAADVTYWLAQRAGTSTFRILNANFQEVRAVNLGVNSSAAAMTPDGSRFLVLANGLRIFDAATGNEVQIALLDVGPNPTDIAVSSDSRRAFVFSAQAQRVTAIDLQTNQVVGTLPVPGVTSGFLAMGPNGLLYVSAETRVLEVLPHATPFDSTAVRRTITINGNIGKLHFTPDGTRAIAANRNVFAPALLYHINLDPTTGGVATTPAADALQGLLFEKLTIAGNNLAYGVTAAGSAAPRRLYQITIPNLPAAGLVLDPAGASEAFFGSLATIPIVDNVSVSREHPRGRYAFISAPLNLLNPASPSTLYQIDLTNNNAVSQVTLPFTAGLNGPVAPVQTLATTTPATVITYNSAQPPIAPGGRSLPLGVRVLNFQGEPIFGASVSFSTNVVGASFEPAGTVTTNADGFAHVRVIAPAVATSFNVLATIAGTSLTGGFNLVAGTGGGGGGGGGGTGQTINILSGNGQVMREGDSARFPYVVQVVDNAGNPVPNATVTWTVTEGGGQLFEGTVTETFGQRTTVTDNLGRTQNTFQAPVSIGLGNSFATSVITVSTPSGGTTLHTTTIVRTNGDGSPAPGPSIDIIAPTEPRILSGRAGETVQDAIVVRFTNSAFPAIGAPIPNVGIQLLPGGDPATSPTAECTPKTIPLTDTTGLVTCSVKFGGRTGSGFMVLSLGAIGETTIPINVQPGVPSALAKVSGDNQSGRPSQALPNQLVAQVRDGGGNPLAGVSVRWEILSGTATVNPVTSVSDSSGNVRTSVTLGTSAGAVQIKATVLAGSQPSVLFGATVTQVLGSLTKVSGDNQTAFTSSAFPQALVVEVRDTQGAAVVGTPVNFSVSGPASIPGSGTVNTDAQGRAVVIVHAGGSAGTVTVTATAGSLPAVSFTLTVRLPGPVFDAASFRNVASNQVGVVPGGLVRIFARGVATGINGVVQANLLFGPLPTRLRDVEVQFGSTLAPILQLENINNQEAVVVQAPFDLVGPGNVPVTIRVGAGNTLVNGVQVLEIQPGVFEHVDAQNRRFAVLMRPNGTYVTPDNPARRGELIKAYFTGGGSNLLPRANTGQPGQPGQMLVNQLVVGVNDAGVRVVSAQYAAGMIGVYEVVFEVPADTALGTDRPFAIAVIRGDGQAIFGNGSRIAIGP